MTMEKKDEKKSKMKVSPEQIEKAAESMGKAASWLDTVFSNLKDGLGSTGKALGAAILVTVVVAIFMHPGLLFVFLILLGLGLAPTLYKKSLEFKAVAEANKAKAEAKKAAQAAALAAKDEPKA
jgi:hypothetical protein